MTNHVFYKLDVITPFHFFAFFTRIECKGHYNNGYTIFIPSPLFSIFVLFIRLYLMQNCFKLRYDELNLACIGRCSINEHLMTILFSFISSYFMSLKPVHGDVIQCQVISTMISNNLIYRYVDMNILQAL